MPTKRFLPSFLLAFCAVASFGPVAAERKTPAQSNSASTALIETASRQYESGQLDQAAATLERALHIQPNNPATLHYLGVLRLQQGQYQQAQTLALRSNMRITGNEALRNRNLQLIQAAQQAQASGIPPKAQENPVAVQKAREAEVAAATAGPQSAGQFKVAALEPEPASDEITIPRGHWPPPGQCRIWFADRQPGQQPPPGSCKKLRKRVPPGAVLMQG
ncbi:tetratricopeptide repeat protein [Pseudomonas sp. YuFO20]|uniref:tetratricopeptide repeat protein n=1 Tax=Pseudomonas sp. YuFO20 TaxID=3095362 RepID=UPI002B2554B0|nr:tetratricopeptide repeat protein [Pseudomonas sp. YuFO20]MEB2517096.1 tetratricopeptide repeat protein [Pseudomonas sp. YuFO20]